MKNKGFTLIELLGVITLLGIILLVTIPAMTKYSGKARNQSLDTMAKSIYEGGVAKYMDDGIMLDACIITGIEDPCSYTQMQEKFKTTAPGGDKTKGAGGCSKFIIFPARDLDAQGYVESLMSPYKDGTTCDGAVQIIKVKKDPVRCPGQETAEDAENYFYRVYLKCSGNHELVKVYTTTAGDGEKIEE